MSSVSVLVVNLNNLEFTKNCIEDLKSQDRGLNLTLVDQNSSEEGTRKYLEDLLNSPLGAVESVKIVINRENESLNKLWNDFVLNCTEDFCCLLNNDVRIAPNFLSSAIQVLEKEPNIGFVNHVTNNKDYQEWSSSLEYRIIETPYRQGWDPVFRREVFSKIPDGLDFFYGDDYIYSKLYSSGMKGAYVLNSPMIHFERSTTAEKGGQRDASPDGLFFDRLDLEFKNMTFVEELSRWKPEFNTIERKISLSILICSLEEREGTFLERLISVLNPQVEKKEVEIIILSDNGEIPIGTKRNKALRSAKGEYVCFVDDDDLVSENYVDSILRKIPEGRDVIVFDALISFNGSGHKIVKYGKEFDYCEKDEAYYRHPNHLMVHKRSNIKEFFLDIRTGEDDEWAKRRLSSIKTESRINEILYFYDYRTDTKKYFSENLSPIQITPMDNLLEISIKRPSGIQNLEGSIYIKVNGSEKEEKIFSFPLYFIVTDLFDRVVWETTLYPGWFSSWPWLTWTKSKIIDSSGNIVWEWRWDPIEHGCVCHQIFYLWSLKNRGSFGIAIGTHDGTFGEWVGPVNEGILKGLLIEGSSKNFDKLNEFYKGKNWISCENNLITPRGGKTSFYQGGSGHTNSVLKSHTEITVNENEIEEIILESESLISLLEKNKNTKWLHIDVEGIDDDLILSLKERTDLLPELIVYEHESLGKEREEKLAKFLNDNGFYIIRGESRNSIAIR